MILSTNSKKSLLKKVLFNFIFLGLITSCTGGGDEKLSCDELSMKCYRGFPRACNAVKTKCSSEKITYTKEKCQKAFNRLLLGGKIDEVKNLFGDPIVGCFSESELSKYGN